MRSSDFCRYALVLMKEMGMWMLISDGAIPKVRVKSPVGVYITERMGLRKDLEWEEIS